MPKSTDVCLMCGRMKPYNKNSIQGASALCFYCKKPFVAVTFGVHIQYKHGSFEAWQNSTSKRITGVVPYDEIDTEMWDIIKALNDAELYTTDCCCGHNKRFAIISFDTCVKKELIIAALSKSTPYTIINEYINAFIPEVFDKFAVVFNFSVVGDRILDKGYIRHGETDSESKANS